MRLNYSRLLVNEKKSVSCLIVFNSDTMGWGLPGSSVQILQAGILEWVAILFSRGSSQPRDRTWVSCITGRFLYRQRHQGSPCLLITQAHTWPTTSHFVCFAQSCPTLCDPMDCSPPGSSVHGILQAGILEWVAILWLSCNHGFLLACSLNLFIYNL